MPTATETRALGFFAGVILLGAAVRVVDAAGERTPRDAAAQVALQRQIAAVDSARQAEGDRRRGRASGRRGRRPALDSTPEARPTVDGGAWRPAARRPAISYARQRLPVGRLGDDTLATAASGGPPGAVRIDADIATAAELERLPRIGPALARRIVADRDAHGPFGSLAGLTRVRGIGPATARILAPYVTFTLAPRPSGEGDTASGAAGGRGRRLRKPRSP